jgi:hypothetical protein
MKRGRGGNTTQRTSSSYNPKKGGNIWKLNTPTVKQIMDKVKKVSRLKKRKNTMDPAVIVN